MNKPEKTIQLFKVFMSPDVLDPVCQILMSGYVGQGPLVDEFEKKLKEFFNNDYICTVNSGTSALHLAVHMVTHGTFQQGDEILTTPMTCTATNSAILANNVRLRWVDVDPLSGNMDMDDLERKLSPKTKSIMVVHWSGYPHDLDRLAAIQKKCYDLYGFSPPIIEDCAHAFGSTYKGKLIGTHGNYSCFSFQAIKHLTTIDGGMLISPNASEHKRAKLLRWFGLDREGSADFRCAQNIQEWGYKFHMHDVSGAIGLYNLPHIPGLVRRHQENSDYYDKTLAGIPGITLMRREADRVSASWIYTIRVERREDFKRVMESKGIHVSQVHARNDVHKCFSDFRCALPNMDRFDKDMICIPNGWWVTDEDRQYIVDQIKSGW